ncbi:MAG: alkaline phosphatase family protein [Patescibacteria group bacterium]|nr:alkaline phosphatase family protein [Patescibacteria group bacterium]MDE2015233.1 alkaline phosphatase family protein [Patescibacteria group bacterium]MDE2227039.1 alkaline phosphatase family protein [Patescibacteria group bacterium]
MVKKSKPRPRVFFFGIDGASPDLIFKKWRKELPTMSRLMSRGVYMETRSSIPPISIAAWSSIFSGKDPSELGIFGYSHKGGYITSNQVREKRIWEILSEQKKNSVVLYVPLTFPAKRLNGVMVTDFLTPGINSNCTYPQIIKNRIKKMDNPELFFDVALGLAGHKGMKPGDLVKKTYKMTHMQLGLANQLLTEEDWDFFAVVMLGSDRLQHMLWNHFDEKHPRYIKNSPYKNAVKNYYKYLDKELGKMVYKLPPGTPIIVASDHGMVRQLGKININNWLIDKGFLVLKPEYKQTAGNKKIWFSKKIVDMNKSLAYASGAYHARIFINKKLAGKKYGKIIQEIRRKLSAIRDPKGRKLATKIFNKDDIYQNPHNPECPDLTVYFDNLQWASNPDLGSRGLYSWESAAGADSAGHSDTGMAIISGNEIKKRGRLGKSDIRQIAPTILKLLRNKIPSDIKAQPLI